jgi:hypothetical protein
MKQVRHLKSRLFLFSFSEFISVSLINIQTSRPKAFDQFYMSFKIVNCQEKCETTFV